MSGTVDTGISGSFSWEDLRGVCNRGCVRTDSLRFRVSGVYFEAVELTPPEIAIESIQLMAESPMMR
jgi:hypothetical protein